MHLHRPRGSTKRRPPTNKSRHRNRGLNVGRAETARAPGRHFHLQSVPARLARAMQPTTLTLT